MTGRTETIPRAAVNRLSLYLRQLELYLAVGRDTVSSSKIGQSLGISDAQVRKDLALFGQFGYPGVGYRVAELREALRTVLGTNRVWKTGLIGIGNLGRALIGYGGFGGRGFSVEALFDADPALIATTVAGLKIRPMTHLEQATRELGLELAILAVPSNAAQRVADAVCRAGIVGILNFDPIGLNVPEGVGLVSVDLAQQLEQLAFHVQHLPSHAGDSPEAPAD